MDPLLNPDALSCLIWILRVQAPTVALLSVILSLPPKFGNFVAIVMTGWVSSHYVQLLSCLQQLYADNLLRDGRLRKSEVGNNDGNSGSPRYVTILPFFEIYVPPEVAGSIDENLVR